MRTCQQMALTLPEAVFDGGPTGDVVDERQLCAIAWALASDGRLKEVDRTEARLIAKTDESPSSAVIEQVASAIRSGEDPLGTAFASLRSAVQRRKLGATYTPASLIGPMSEWLANHKRASRVVDPGAGSARFLLAAGRLLPEARLVAVEIDPLASLVARANLTVLGFDGRSEVHTADFRTLTLAPAPGPTAFIGNPPYVRHHDIASNWKAWLRRRSEDLGLKASALAGLHVHFLLATAHLAQAGDFGVFVTSSEWLDVGYGQLARDLMAGPLGGLSVHVLDARSQAFADAATTAAVSAFEVGASQRDVRVRKIKRTEDLRGLRGGKRFSREKLRTTRRWSSLLEPKVSVPREFVPLGEFCRVHRGAVTGANSTWVTAHGDPRLPESVLVPTVTRAAELFNLEAGVLDDSSTLRVVIDLPADLDVLDSEDRELVVRFLNTARRTGAAAGYIARHRNPWWSVKLRYAAPILATYMARRPPAFVRNLAEAKNLNTVHGIYPLESLSESALCRLTKMLRDGASLTGGRTYAGGLTKFEPSEMAQIMVPPPSWLESDEPWRS